jgi:hypothetical protein
MSFVVTATVYNPNGTPTDGPPSTIMLGEYVNAIRYVKRTKEALKVDNSQSPVRFCISNEQGPVWTECYHPDMRKE